MSQTFVASRDKGAVQTYDGIGRADKGAVEAVLVQDPAKCYNALFGRGNYESADASLEGHWELNDTTGTTATDSSGNGRNGTINGMGANPTTGSVSGGPKWLGQAFDFDGSDDFISGIPSIALGSGEFTMMAWANNDTASGYQAIIGKDKVGARDWVFGINDYSSASRSFLYDFTGTFDNAYANGSVAASLWKHQAFTRNGSGILTPYTNGSSVSAVYTNGSSPWNGSYTGTGDIHIGQREYSGFNQRWNGRLGDVAIFSRSLASAEIAEAYSGPEPYLSGTAPTITGTVSRGSTITINHGTWNSQSNGTLTYHVSLYSYSDTSGTDERLEKTYTTTLTSHKVILRGSAIVGRHLRAVVTCENDGGFDPAEVYWTSYTSAVAKDGPVLWIFPSIDDDANGGAFLNDLSGESNSVSLTGTYSWVADTDNSGVRAISIDAASSYISTAVDESLDNLGPVTICFWHKGSPSTGNQLLNNSRFKLNCSSGSNDRLYFYVDMASGDVAAAADNAVTDGSWTHITITWDGSLNGSGIQFYKNGSAITTNASSDGGTDNTAETALNIGYNGSDWDDIRIYDRVLSATEIAEIAASRAVVNEAVTRPSYNALFGRGKHLEDPSLEGWWLLNENDTASTVVNDSSTNGVNGTFSGEASTSVRSSSVVPSSYHSRSFSLDGSNDFITFGDVFDAPAKFSLGLWVRSQSSPLTNRGLIGRWNTNGYMLWCSTNQYASTVVNGATHLEGSSDISEMTWFHVAGTYDGTNARVYVGGSLEGTQAESAPSTVSADFMIGKYNAVYYPGYVAEGYKFARDLSDSEVALTASGPEPINITAPVISGTETEGQTLSATTGTWGLDSIFGTGATNGTITYSYQWYRSGTPIEGATSSTYTLVAADVGETITVTVRGTNAGGYDEAEDTTSAATGVIQASGGATYTGSASLASGAASLSATATYAPGTATANAAVTVGGATAEASATFAPPVYTSAAALASGAAVVTATAAYAAAIFQATIDAVSGGATADAAATFAPPVYASIADFTSGAAVVSATAFTGTPTFAATADLISGSGILVGTATTAAPTFSATADLTSGAATIESTAAYAAAVFLGTASVIGPPPSIYSLASFEAGTFTGSAPLNGPAGIVDASASFSGQVFDAAASVTSAGGLASALATFDPGSFAASISIVTGGAVVDIAASFVPPVYSGNAAMVSPAGTATASATSNPPSFTASVDVASPGGLVEATGGFTPPVFVAAGVIYVHSATITVAYASATIEVPSADVEIVQLR